MQGREACAYSQLMLQIIRHMISICEYYSWCLQLRTRITSITNVDEYSLLATALVLAWLVWLCLDTCLASYLPWIRNSVVATALCESGRFHGFLLLSLRHQAWVVLLTASRVHRCSPRKKPREHCLGLILPLVLCKNSYIPSSFPSFYIELVGMGS
jgi:hypothetical protein